MTIRPTLAGGLKMTPVDEKDWYVLFEIASDGEGDLSNRLAQLMDEDSMWNEIVVPELDQEFSEQRRAVMNDVVKAKKEDGGIHIGKKSAGAWYGALNQARMGLEERYQFDSKEFLELLAIGDPEARTAYYRNNFYQKVQEMLLLDVMEE